MHTSTSASLLDEQGFLAELEHLEQGMAGKRRPVLPPVAGRDEGAELDIDLHAITRFHATEEDPAADDSGPQSLLWRVTTVAMFVFFMGVGAAGAAVVFHEQVARILATW